MYSRFDEAAQQWDNNPDRVALARAIGDAIQRTVPIQPRWDALDYGAGTGLLTLNLQPRVCSILALDASPGMLQKLTEKIAAARIGNLETRLWNLEADPFPEKRFDLVVSSMTLHHLRDVSLVFKRLAAVLRPGGWLAVADLDVEDGSFHGQADDVFHHGFERSEIAGWLESAGLCEVRISTAHTITKPSASNRMRSYEVFLAVGQRPANVDELSATRL
jgi:ubiquinone/menaquinone biosynthesis C-methylase UbiE